MWNGTQSKAKQMFAIGIRDIKTGLQEGLCDIHFESISVEQLQAITDICEEQVITPIRNGHKMEIVDTLRAIADVIVKGTVAVDVNLQHHGINEFAKDVTDAVLLFVRCDKLWPENIYEIGEEGKNATKAHAFLFGTAEHTFHIGLVENGEGQEVCEVTMHLDLLICKELIHLLEEELLFDCENDIETLMDKIRVVTGGIVVRKTVNPFAAMHRAELLFIKEGEMVYNGNVRELLAFLSA